MKIAIVYESRTGTTARAAEAIGQFLETQGHHCQVHSISQADPAQVAAADLICVGAWVKGWFIVRQRPSEGAISYMRQLGDLTGKKVVVFCTYKLAIGSTLSQMASAVAGKGAVVVGRFKFRGPEPDGSFREFASTLN